jgi:putative NIF3 family GTP cyclohydrolase 1 type 2
MPICWLDYRARLRSLSWSRTSKTETSKWGKKAERGNPKFAWQSGYGAFSVSHSLRENVDQYIRNQAEHHARISYEDEYRRICEKHEIEIDERYVWD